MSAHLSQRANLTAYHDALAESEPYDFRLFRLQRQGQAILAVSHDQEMLTAALEVGLEVR